MRDDVPFSEVLRFLERHGYRLLRRRKDPSDENAGFAVFGRENSPNIGLPVKDRKVSNEHFQNLIQAFEANEGQDESEG